MGIKKVIDAERLDAAMTATADAIREKGGTAEPIPWNELTGFSDAVGAIPTGVAAAAPKDVNFYDYDGTILYSYTVEEAAALTELPPLPSHDGLICQGWKRTLESIRALGRGVDVGALYITDDGRTRIYITLRKGYTSPILGVCPNGTVTVDWGDGTAPDVLTGTSIKEVKWTPTHEYAAEGDYVIKLTVDGTMDFNGAYTLSGAAYILRHSADGHGKNRIYLSSVRKVEIGSGVTSIGNYAFCHCTCLETVTIPDGITNIGGSICTECASLKSLTFPDSVTTINAGGNTFERCYSLTHFNLPDGIPNLPNYLFEQCYSLKSITIPDGVTSIGGNVFSSNYNLLSLVIPPGITSIVSKAFFYCYGITCYDFTRHTVVPTLHNTNSFTSINKDCEIRVPAALADEWKAATNWATYADYIVGV